jgi:hypothetical protein
MLQSSQEVQKTQVIYDDEMDERCISLCDAINRIEGLQTTSSCEGHGKGPFSIYFDIDAQGLKNLGKLLYYIDSCHYKIGWTVRVYGTCSLKSHFILESPSKGEKAYEEANEIANALNTYLDGR